MAPSSDQFSSVFGTSRGNSDIAGGDDREYRRAQDEVWAEFLAGRAFIAPEVRVTAPTPDAAFLIALNGGLVAVRFCPLDRDETPTVVVRSNHVFASQLNMNAGAIDFEERPAKNNRAFLLSFTHTLRGRDALDEAGLMARSTMLHTSISGLSGRAKSVLVALRDHDDGQSNPVAFDVLAEAVGDRSFRPDLMEKTANQLSDRGLVYMTAPEEIKLTPDGFMVAKMLPA